MGYRKFVYKARNGKVLATIAECKEHDLEETLAILARKTAKQFREALNYYDDAPDGEPNPSTQSIADAIETIGSLITQARKRAGKFKKNMPSGGKKTEQNETLPLFPTADK